MAAPKMIQYFCGIIIPSIVVGNRSGVDVPGRFYFIVIQFPVADMYAHSFSVIIHYNIINSFISSFSVHKQHLYNR